MASKIPDKPTRKPANKKKPAAPSNPATVIAIDQSYVRVGIGIAHNGELIKVESFPMPKDKKNARQTLARLIKRLEERYQPEYFIVERVRLWSGNHIAIQTIIALSQLVTTIIDATDLKIYSVDTKSWKSRVLGTANATKDDAVGHMRGLGFEVDHDAADAGCMALYAYVADPLLKQET